MSDPYFFGYGSLVNRGTHAFPDPRPATLPGWRRIWRHAAHRPVAFLTAEPCPGVEIDGLTAAVPGHDWAALDLREANYDRVPATGLRHDLDDAAEVAVYTIPAGRHAAPDTAHPVLLSYVDVVVQGFLAEFGEDGVARFFETTKGWDAPVANDRHAPLYARARQLSDGERGLVDTWLAHLGARRFCPVASGLAREIELRKAG